MREKVSYFVHQVPMELTAHVLEIFGRAPYFRATQYLPHQAFLGYDTSAVIGSQGHTYVLDAT